MGFKAMNLAPGHGVRYQVHLYRANSGELLAIMDAQHLTTLRTGATSAVATTRLARSGLATVALLGSGLEAHAQLEAMQALGIVKSAKVFSVKRGMRSQPRMSFGQTKSTSWQSWSSAKRRRGLRMTRSPCSNRSEPAYRISRLRPRFISAQPSAVSVCRFTDSRS